MYDSAQRQDLEKQLQVADKAIEQAASSLRATCYVDYDPKVLNALKERKFIANPCWVKAFVTKECSNPYGDTSKWVDKSQAICVSLDKNDTPNPFSPTKSIAIDLDCGETYNLFRRLNGTE